MKSVTSLLLLLAAIQLFGQSENPDYDSELAKKLGADDYGMKMYVLVILKTGGNNTTDNDKLQKLFAGHMENIKDMADLGKLIVAGPLGKNEKSYRGIFILNVPSFEDAKKLLEMDPAVKENIFDVEMFKWYGSAALSEYLPVHKKITKTEP